MKYILTSVTVILFFLAAVTSLSAQNKNSVRGDLEALRALYNATDGDNWKNNSGWLNGNPSNKWYGVEVNREGRVIRLDLYKNNLSGELPKSIGNLSKLQFFSVKRNPVYSRIPRSIKNWANAETVMFSSGSDHNLPNENTYNDHSGKSPTSAVAKYYGSIPDVFDKMPNLRILQIAWQEDLEGQPYPSTLYSHPSLKILELQGTKLTGTLKDSFNLPEMRRFIIGNNHLEGSIPASFGLMTKVVNFRLNHSDLFVRNTPNVKRFTGPLPSTFSNFSQIKYFYLSNQSFSGEIPGYIVKNWPGLREINLNNNNFTGEIPKEFGDFDLTVFSLRNNNFSGVLHPNLVSGMQRVIIFNVRHNNLSGEFPNGQMVNGEWKGWRTKKRLRTVTLDHNNFTGPLPDMPEYVGDMSLYTAHSNNFTGGIPDTWEELFTPALRDKNPKRTFNNLQLRGNQLQGILPAWFTSENFDGRGIDLKGNRWSRRDILENGVNVSVGVDHDAPQLPFGQQVVFKRLPGSSIEYDYSQKVHSKDKIKWSKFNDSTGQWEHEESLNNTGLFEITNIKESDYGSYRLELTNTRTPLPKTIVSEPIIIEEGDGSDSEGSDSSDGSGEGANNGEAGNGDTGGTDDGSTNNSSGEGGIDDGNEKNGNSDGGTNDGSSGGSDLFPAAPVPYGPDDDSKKISLKPQITWSDIEADYYILHVSRQNPSGKTIDVVVNDTTFTPDEIFDDGTVHDWRVRGVKGNEQGEWSGVQRFTTGEENLPDVADLVSPGHFAQNVDRSPKLSWEDVGADSYEFRLIYKKTSELIFSDVSQNTSYRPIEALPDTSEFVWQVRSIKGGVQGSWGPRWEFSTGEYQFNVDAPILTAPAQGSEYSYLTPTFEWEDMDADRYVIIITREDPINAKSLNGMTNTSTTVLHEETTETTYTPAISLEPETDYYWKVQAVKDGEEGEWSDLREFTLLNLSAPVLYGPDDDRENVSLSPEFRWSDNGADYYILHVSRQDPSAMILDVIVNDTTFTPDEIFDDGTFHDWRVRGVKDGEQGEWSDIQRLKTGEENLPDVAEYGFPAHFAQNVDQATEMAWEDVGADSYEVRLLNKKTSDLLFSEAITDTSYSPIEALPDTTDFVWQVKSISGGVHGAWGPRWEFSTGVYGIEPPNLFSPVEGSSLSNLVPTFEWEDVDADRYVILITRDNPTNAKGQNSKTSKSTTVIHEETTETTFTSGISLEPDTQYYWQVQAVKDGKKGEWSDLWEFTLSKPMMAQKAVSVQSNEQKPVITSLEQNYPNPFNPTTRIEFALSGAQKVSLKVYDMAGRQVAMLIDNVLQAGHHSATFDASHLSSGIYIYRFISDTHQFSRKMTLIK